MYFKEFPKILYTVFDEEGRPHSKLASDITKNVRIRKEILDNAILYETYDVREGETPEIIAEKLYGNPEYHWVVMIANQKYSLTDFPLTSKELDKLIEDKYTDANAVHHYVNSDGYIVNSDFPGARAVSNFEYEVDQNEKKRRIKIISPRLLPSIISTFKDIL